MATIWRAVRTRGWRAVFAVGLLSAALAANTIVFSAADAFVFDRVPYMAPARLVEIANHNPQSGAIGSGFISAAVLDEWRRQPDVFSSVHVYLTKTVFVTAGETARTPAADITPGLFELLGARPLWGRSFSVNDAAQIDPQVAIVSEGLARERFGDPARAVGQLLPTATQPLLVVGVMPAAFHFPYATTRIWRALDPRGPLAAGFGGASAIARLADGVPFDAARDLTQQRAPAVGSAAGVPRAYHATIRPLQMAASPDTQRRLLLAILGTAICLLLTACANVAGIELAGAIGRMRTYAIRLALGESRGHLIGVSLAEGFTIVALATIVAVPLAAMGLAGLAATLPDSIRLGTVNPIDLDGRALLFMVAAALMTWLLAAFPPVLFATRANVGELLKQGGALAPPGSRMRQFLTALEVAIAVVLLAGTALYVRTYVSLVRLDKGFDSRNVALASVSVPARVLPSLADKRAFAASAISRLVASHVAVSGMWGSPPPDVGAAYEANLEVDGRPVASDDITVAALNVEPAYFSTLGIPLRGGRTFVPEDAAGAVVVSEAMASRLWPGVDPIGHTFRWGPQQPWLHVVGVAGNVRNDRDPPGGVNTDLLQIYRPLPAAPPAVGTAPRPDNGGSYWLVNMVLRVDGPAPAAEAASVLRDMEPRGQVEVRMLDDVYARQYGDRLLAARIMGAFGLLAFVLAGAGIYGVMAFLVVSRAREIGIRMALGADGAAIRHLILRSSAGLVAAGVAVGTLVALAGARAISSQLFGVTAADPLTWVAVLLTVAVVAGLATWRPARAATRVDPSVLLRH